MPAIVFGGSLAALCNASAGTPGAIRTPAPALGQDTREVLGEFGIDVATIDALVEAGVAKAR